MAEKNNPPASRGLVAATVSFYLVAALSMVMANKWVLNSTEVPLFFLLSQLVIAVLLFLASNATGALPAAADLTVDWNVAKGLAPMIGLNVVGLSFSNYTLKYVDASFYQVARGLVLPFTVATSYYFLSVRPSAAIIVACSLVTAGFFAGVFLDSIPVSLIGVSFGVASSAITACHAVVIKRSLDVVNGSALLLSWYMNFLSALVLAPLVIILGELPGIWRLFTGSVAKSEGMSALGTFIWGSAITGALGFMMSIASLLSIKITSPITHMVSSAVRGVAASLLGMWLFNDVITTQVIPVHGRASSIGIILLGSIYYTWVKHNESQAPKQDHRYERVPLEEVENGTAKPA